MALSQNGYGLSMSFRGVLEVYMVLCCFRVSEYGAMISIIMQRPLQHPTPAAKLQGPVLEVQRCSMGEAAAIPFCSMISFLGAGILWSGPFRAPLKDFGIDVRQV